MESESRISEDRRPVRAAARFARDKSRPVTSRFSSGVIGTRNRWVDSRGGIVKFVASWGWELAFLTSIGIAIMLWLLPDFWADRSGVTDPQDRADLENSFRSTLAQIVGGFVVLVALYSTLRRVRAAERTVEITEQGQITERFTRAIEQLGAVHAPTSETAKEFPAGRPSIEVRLGGIYALERIARDSERDFWPIMEVLTAYVRENAPFVKREEPPQVQAGDEGATNEEAEPGSAPAPEGEADPSSNEDGAVANDANEPPPKPRTDVQAVLTVIGRRESRFQKAGERLDLSGTDLRGAKLTGLPTEKKGKEGRALGFDLAGANLSNASLDGADLRNASLYGAYLSGASLDHAKLRLASLDEAELANASLNRADLTGASLNRAWLSNASLNGADLIDASFDGAYMNHVLLDGGDLVGVRLNRAQLRHASLEHANLYRASLSGTDLSGASLIGARLELASLDRAFLDRASLDGAFLGRASLDGASLTGASLKGAALYGAKMSTARSLTQDQVDSADGDARTELPEGITRPAHWLD